jgi:hypothetical protein
MNLNLVIIFTIGLLANQLAVNEAYIDDENNESSQEEFGSSDGGGVGSVEPIMSSDPCYDRLTGKPQRCIPNFENVAYGRRVVASSTCGAPPINYCINSNNSSTPGLSGANRKHGGGTCEKCDARVSGSVREAKFLTDLEETNTTCWVSGPVYEPAQLVNLTLDIAFGKKYELTYIRYINEV